MCGGVSYFGSNHFLPRPRSETHSFVVAKTEQIKVEDCVDVLAGINDAIASTEYCDSVLNHLVLLGTLVLIVFH